MRISIVFFMFLFSTSSVVAQIDFKTVDVKTYDFYQKAQWDSLISIGKEAKKQDVDYYYLNYRMGVAYFYKSMFYSASYYFEKAMKQNVGSRNDSVFNKYLYLSYIYTLRYGNAMTVPIDSTNTSLRKKLTRSSIFAFGGAGSVIPIDNKKLQKKGNVDLSFTHYQQGNTIWGIAAHHQLYPWLSFDISYTNIQFSDVAAVDTDDSLTIRTSTISQQNISLIPEFRINEKWQIRLAFAYSFNSGAPYVLSTYSPYGPYLFEAKDYNEENYLLGANVYRQFRNFKLGLEMGISNYSNTNQTQFGLNLTYYPFSNLNLYSYTSASVKFERNKSNFIIHQDLGFKVMPKLWMEIGGTFGEMKNFNVFNLGYGYNTTDHIKMLLNAKLIYLFNSNIELFIEGHYYKRNGMIYNFYPDKASNRSKLNYNYWSVSGGLIWKF